MLAVNGFFGHAQKNHFRSVFMFVGFMLSMHITVAALLSIPFPFWNHLPVLFSEPLEYVIEMGPLVTAVNFVIFTLFYFCHIQLLKWTVGFEPVSWQACPRLHQITQNLANTAGIKMPKLDYIASPALNAFACGLTPASAHIVVTQGLLDGLDDEELEAVIAHEIAHIKNGDMHMMAVANAAIGSIRTINFINPMKLKFLGYLTKIPPIFIIFLFPFVMILGVLLILLVFYAFILQLASVIANATRLVISSSREFIADADAVQLTHNPAALISALNKIHGRSFVHGTGELSRAMMIDGPTTGRMASHPTIRERITKLYDLSGSMVHGTGVRKDTRTQSLQAYGGDAYGHSGYAGSNIAPARSFSFGFSGQAQAQTSPRNVRAYIPDSKDYAGLERPVHIEEEPESIFDRISFGDDDGEYGLGRPVRWAMIFVLAVVVWGDLKKEYYDRKDGKSVEEKAPFIAGQITPSHEAIGPLVLRPAPEPEDN